MQGPVVAFINALVAARQAPITHQVAASFRSFDSEVVRSSNFDGSVGVSWTMKGERFSDGTGVLEHTNNLLPHFHVLVGV